MLSDHDVLEEFRAAGALLEGHFVLSSGLRSPAYFQCARVFMEAKRAEKLCAALAAKLKAKGVLEGVEVVISPAMGGVIAGYEMGRQLGLPAVFFERVEGAFCLRRGFDIKPGQGLLMMEDVVTTGLSSRECIAAAEALGGKVLAASALLDRSMGRADLGVPFVPLVALDVPAYKPDELPDELKNIPAIKPGSRGLKS